MAIGEDGVLPVSMDATARTVQIWPETIFFITAVILVGSDQPIGRSPVVGRTAAPWERWSTEIGAPAVHVG
ncbi:hypothetical protein ACLOJK_005251 [Asimina triloba]